MPPVARQPVARQPVARQPVARQPVARQPVALTAIAGGGGSGHGSDVFVPGTAALAEGREAFAEYGLAVFDAPAVAPPIFADLRREAARQRRLASWPLRSGDGRSRVPETTVRGHFGPAAVGFVGHPALAKVVEIVTGQRVTASWSASCYTWYDRPGAWLSRHTDHPERCCLALIVGIESYWPPGSPVPPGNQLWFYDSLAAPAPRFRVTTRPNRVTILDGLRWVHERPPVQSGQHVAVLCACFRQPSPA